MAKTSTEIIIEAGQAESTIKQMEAAVSILNNELKKMPVNTQEFADKREELAKMRDRIKEVRTGVSSLGQSTEEATKAAKEMADQVIVDGRKMGASINEMEAAMQELNQRMKQVGSNTKEFAQLNQEIREMRNTIKAAKESAEDLKAEGNKIDTAFGKFTETIEQAVDGMGWLGKAMQAAMASTIILAVLDQFYQLVQWISETDSKVKQLSGSISRLTGERGDALQETSVQIQAIATTFGKETNEVLQSANTMSKEFGISMQEALGMMEQGFLSGADSSGEMLEQIREYSTQFKAAGMSAEEMIAIVQRSTTEGVFSDKGADVVKEFGLRIREQTTATSSAMVAAFGQQFTDEIFGGINSGSMTTVEALKRISAEMGTSKATASQLQTVVADVFGGPGEDAGMKYLLSLKDISGNLDALVDDTNTLTATQKAQLAMNKDLARAEYELGEAFAGTGGFMELVYTQAKILAIDGFVALVDIIQNAFAPVLAQLNGESGRLATLWSEYVTPALSAVWEVVKALAEVLLSGMVSGVQMVVTVWTAMVNNVLGFIPAIDGARFGIGSFSDVIYKTFIPAIHGMLAALGEARTQVGSFVADLLAGNFEKAFAAIDPSKVAAKYRAAVEAERAAVGSGAPVAGNTTVTTTSTTTPIRSIGTVDTTALGKAIEEKKKKEEEAHKTLADLREFLQLEELTKLGQNEADWEEQQEELKKQREQEKAAKEAEELKLKQQETDLSEMQEQLLLDQKRTAALDSAAAYEQAQFDLQKKYIDARLDIMRNAGKEESKEFVQLQLKKSEVERKETEFRMQMKEAEMNAARGFLSVTAGLLSQDKQLRKEYAGVIKAMQAAEITMSGIAEVQYIWRNSASLGPWGTALAVAQTAAAAVRTGMALREVASVKAFASGGHTFQDGGGVAGPTLGLIGEAGPEWVAPNWMLRTAPYADIISGLEGARQSRAYAAGGSTSAAVSSAGAGPAAMPDLGNEEMLLLLRDIRNGVQSFPDQLQVVAVMTEVDAALERVRAIRAEARIQ